MKNKLKFFGWIALGFSVPFLFTLGALYSFGIELNIKSISTVFLVWAIISIRIYMKLKAKKDAGELENS